jgi:hypothetical protein
LRPEKLKVKFPDAEKALQHLLTMDLYQVIDSKFNFCKRILKLFSILPSFDLSVIHLSLDSAQMTLSDT